MRNFSADLSLGAQTSYAELFDAAQANDLAPFATLTGSFQQRTIKGHQYVYFGYRDTDGTGRMAYVGPNNDRVKTLVANYIASGTTGRQQLLREKAAAAKALGNAEMLPKHFLIVQKLSAYGFFKAGGVLVGTHAFSAFGNMLGVRWTSGDKTLDVDFAHAGKNLSIALPASLKLSVHDALTSLEMGLLPVREFSGATGAQYRNPDDPELRIDFLTSSAGRANADGVIKMDDLGLALEPLKFMEFSLEGTTQGAVFSRAGACVVNLPDPARYAVHKLIVFGERPVAQRAKSNKDIVQAAALAEWHIQSSSSGLLLAAWDDAVSRGPGWRKRAEQGRAELVARYPELAAAFGVEQASAATAKSPSRKRRTP
jgi:hypothetical protein